MTLEAGTAVGQERSAQQRESMRAPRVAFVVSQFPETHETFIVREFAALDALGLDFVIMSLKRCRDKVVQREARRFVGRTYYPFGAGRETAPAPRAFGAAAGSLRELPWRRLPLECAYVAWAAGRLAGLARKLSVEHIHAHWATAPTSAAVLMSRMTGLPYSFTAHAWDIYAGDGRLAAKARGARFVATCTKANVEHIRSLVPAGDREKVVLSYHGVSFRHAHRAPGGARTCLHLAAVGRLVETKGFEYLIRALGQTRFPFELVIAGDGPLRGRLERLSRRLGISSRVSFAGTVPNETVFEILSRSDCLVMPSVIARDGDRDGIPNVLLEAMSVGLPIVASAVSGIPEAVADGQTGLLVEQRVPSAIAGALEWIFRNPVAAERLGAAARDFVEEQFSAEDNARRLYEIFRRRGGRRLQ